MAEVPCTLFYEYNRKLLLGDINWGTDAAKLLLTNTAPVATNSLVSHITQIAAGNGYPSGGIPITVTTVDQSSGTGRVFFDDLLITASGGAMASWRYGVIAVGTSLIGWWDAGSTITLASGQSYSVGWDQVQGAINSSRA